jgi:hypothetical protein
MPTFALSKLQLLLLFLLSKSVVQCLLLFQTLKLGRHPCDFILLLKLLFSLYLFSLGLKALLLLSVHLLQVLGTVKVYGVTYTLLRNHVLLLSLVSSVVSTHLRQEGREAINVFSLSAEKGGQRIPYR